MGAEFSDKAATFFEELFRIFYLKGVAAGIARLEEALQNLEAFSPGEQTYLQNWHLDWMRALDFSYHPSYPTHGEVYPLWNRYHYCHRRDPAEAERTLWQYLQHCAFGTLAFHNALDMLVEFAVERKNFPLARHAAEMLLHHYAILRAAQFNPLTPVGYDDPSLTHELLNEWASLSLPYWAAIEALETDPAQCWVDILELQLDLAPLKDRTEYFYPKVLEAVCKHYRKKGDLIRLEWLEVYRVPAEEKTS